MSGAAGTQLDAQLRARVELALEEGRRVGFLGPGDIGPHIDHALDFVSILHALGAGRVLDLGAGGGLPGLVILAAMPDVSMVLLDAHQRRSAFLRQAVEALGWSDRVEVVAARAEDAGRDPRHRGMFHTVVARSFGPPAVTAECGAPFLHPGGHLVVSEPPELEVGRWPAAGLEQLGLRTIGVPDGAPITHRFTVLQASATCSDRFPRRAGVPARRPLFVPQET